MDEEKKHKLENLKKENKIRIAKNQLICDLSSRYHINIDKKDFIDYQLSADIH